MPTRFARHHRRGTWTATRVHGNTTPPSTFFVIVRANTISPSTFLVIVRGNTASPWEFLVIVRGNTAGQLAFLPIRQPRSCVDAARFVEGSAPPSPLGP
jgi:hypothetical protein